MIPLNTLCLVVWVEPGRPEAALYLGMECTIAASATSPTEWYTVNMRNGVRAEGPRKCFLPITPNYREMPVNEKENEA